MSSNPIKPGWQKVKFGDVVRLSKERSSDPLADGYERYIGLEHIDPEDLRVRRWGNVADGVTFTSVFKPGQVLFGKRRAYQRKVAVADFAGVCSGDIYVLESKDPKKLLPELLPFICQTEAFFQHAVGTSAGSLSPRTNWTSLADFEFALPPLEEQRRIVELLLAVEETIDNLVSARSSAQLLFKAALLESFNSLPENNKKKIADCYEIQLGKMSSEKARFGSNQKTYIKNNNVLWGKFDFGELPQMSFDEREITKYELRKGDLLVCEGGEIGRAAIWQDEIPGMLYQKALHRLRPRTSDDIPEFMFHYLRYCAERGILDGVATGTTIRHLPVEQLSQLALPFPKRAVQEQVASLLSKIESGNSMLDAKICHSRSLKSAVLRQIAGG
ncbi:restriction endonuclease subunit S [Trichlorobacter lovleyi]|jgi:Restriction endonuclease S subunits|uniref:Restriction endonuclease S subunits-like protein n=1 Tax=Trichlorobacter lovleyi (strain ATCC BAA-1151 / DSM 17278 / SZ) TaxID=398767 RepID=B3E503_TRIL1|nr:restriction endonuclease subunit S [Trichlorobacter lovleyi]ACD94568.1 restriction endonuclease S subunits-like protein [Trichlorobacter lovleyi SZ]